MPWDSVEFGAGTTACGTTFVPSLPLKCAYKYHRKVMCTLKVAICTLIDIRFDPTFMTAVHVIAIHSSELIKQHAEHDFPQFWNTFMAYQNLH